MSGLSALVFVCVLATIAGTPSERIVGGSLTTINQYPFTVSVQTVINNNWMQVCGGTIINNRSVLSAAHCFVHRAANVVRSRVGSSNAHSGGTVHNSAAIINHPQYNEHTVDSDISIIRVSTAIIIGGNVRTIGIAGASYNLADNQQVTAIGWGITSWGGPPSEQLRHVTINTMNQNTCRNAHSQLTANMLCAIWPGGGRGPCTRDSGGPLVHQGTLVGVVSFSVGICAQPNAPSVFVRVSRFASWITQNS